MTLLTRRNQEPIPLFEPLDRFIENLWNAPSLFPRTMEAENFLPLDVFEKENVVYVKAAVPGVKPEEFHLTLDNYVLTLWYETKDDMETEPDAKLYRSEARYGKFMRSVRLPEDIEVDKVKAEFENGIVTITVPRMALPKVEPKKIPVKRK